MRAGRGFTLLELLVVVSIMVMTLLVFATVIGSRGAGPPLDRTAAQVAGMVANVRQNASVRKVHGEIVFDYKNDRVVSLSRRRLASFAMESEQGSNLLLGRLSGGAGFEQSRSMSLRDGKALSLPLRQSTFTIPWSPEFDASGDYEGMALAFDFFPMEDVNAQGLGTTVVGRVASMAGVLDISVSAARPDSVCLSLSCGGPTATTRTWLATYRWHRVEVAVSRYGVSLWVDGRLDEAPIKDDFTVAAATGLDLALGGAPCRIDNLEMFSLVSSQTLELDGCQLIAPDVDPAREALGEAENIYKDRTVEAPRRPVTGEPADEGPKLGDPGLPLDPVPAIRHIYYDTAGKLDAARHPGAAEVYMISGIGTDIRRMVLTFHRLGAVTSREVELFPWEVQQAQQVAGSNQ